MAGTWLLCGAVLLLSPVALANTDHRAPPDRAAIEIAESSVGPPETYISARSLVYFLRAILAKDAGDPVKAIEQLRLAALYDTQHAYPEYMLAQEHFLLGQTAPAEAAVRSALTIEPDHEPSLMLLGRICLQRGQVDDALDAFNKAATVNPLDPEPYTWLADAYLSRSDLASALSLSERLDGLAALAHDPAVVRRLQATAAATTTRVADIDMTQGLLDKAEQLYRHAADEEPNRASHLITLAHFYEGQSRLRDAADAFMRAFSVGQDDPQLAVEAAGLYLRVGDRRAALASAEVVSTRATGTDPSLRRSAEALMAIGNELMSEQAPADAQQAFAFASSLVPAWSLPVFRQGEAFERAGELDQAAVLFRRVRGGDPLFVAAQSRAALCEYRQGNHAEAMVMLRGLQKAFPDAPDVVVALATTLEDQGNLKGAAALLEGLPSSKVTPDVARAMCRVGPRIGHDSQVLRMLETAVSRFPGDAELTFELVQALDRAGKRDEAIIEARQLADRAPAMGGVLDFLARALAEQGGSSLAEAEACARRAVLGWPERGRYVRTLALVQEARGSPEALYTWRRAADMLPGDADTQLQLAEAEALAGHADEAQAAYARALALGHQGHQAKIVAQAQRGMSRLRMIARSPEH